MSATETFARAELLLAQRRVAEAIRCFDLAEAAGWDPDRCAGGRWTASMLAADFAAAWQESDAIRRRGAPDPHRLWQGESVDGRRVIVRCLHGFGDAVQFLRYAARLRERAARVTVECAPRLAELARWLPGIDEVITWGPGAPASPPGWDVQVEIMELPYLFRTTVADLPFAVEYLRLPSEQLREAARALDAEAALKVGVVWSAGEWNPARSLALSDLAPILAHDDCRFWNLQGGPVRNRWATLGRGPHLRDAPMLADAGLVPLASFIAQLDLVITVDTLAAHLAGALNIPCFLMLQHAADWRWMVDRRDSPWYPSLQIFRQSFPADRRSPICEAEAALAALQDAKSKATAALVR